MKPPIRKTREAWNHPRHAHFVTYSCYRRFPMLTRDRSRRWVVAAMEETRRTQNLALWACLIMPEHVHILLYPHDTNYEMFDHNIFKEKTVPTAMNYIHNNPVRRGLVATPMDWEWSSARFWDGRSDVPPKMDQPVA